MLGSCLASPAPITKALAFTLLLLLLFLLLLLLLPPPFARRQSFLKCPVEHTRNTPWVPLVSSVEQVAVHLCSLSPHGPFSRTAGNAFHCNSHGCGSCTFCIWGFCQHRPPKFWRLVWVGWNSLQVRICTVVAEVVGLHGCCWGGWFARVSFACLGKAPWINVWSVSWWAKWIACWIVVGLKEVTISLIWGTNPPM